MCFIYLTMKSGRLWMKERDERIIKEWNRRVNE